MVRIKEIFNYLCELAPLELQMDFDNSGFLIGREERNANTVLLTLDVTDEVVAEARDIGAELIISHHPVIFAPLKAVTDSCTYTGRVLELIENRIAVISMHTNLDAAEGGVNDVLLSKFCNNMFEQRIEGCGRMGELEEALDMNDFLSVCRKELHTNGIRYYSCGRRVKKLAVLGGSGASAIEEAYGYGCDTFITADVKYHQFQRAAELGMNLIDADHFFTENPVMYMLAEKLRNEFSELDVRVSEKHTALIEFD